MHRRRLSVLAAVGAVLGGLVAPTVGAPPAHADESRPFIDYLHGLTVAAEQPGGFSSSLFPHWDDADGDGCDTRAEVLLEESVEAVTTTAGCEVRTGRWFTWYDAAEHDTSEHLRVDHLVPLAEAWESGASRWTAATRQAFANDLGFAGTLVVATDTVDDEKGDQDPAGWLPSEGDTCGYVMNWLAVKWRWDLTVDAAERDQVVAVADATDCWQYSMSVTKAGAVVQRPSGDTLAAGSALVVGQELVSADGRHTFVLQGDGNAVVYGPGGRALWQSGTADRQASHLALQAGDGNLVLYQPSGWPLWSSNTSGRSARLVMQSDGNLVQYTSAGAVWQSGTASSPTPPPVEEGGPSGDRLDRGQALTVGTQLTSRDGRWRLVMQPDGNAVVYGPSGATWSSGSAGHPGAKLVVQEDGNAVVYPSAGPALWQSATYGRGGHHLAIQDDGNLVLYTEASRPLWQIGAPAAPVVRDPAPMPGDDPRFGTCTAAKAAGYGPYRRGVDPEYPWYEDRDDDGIVCE